MCLSTRTRLNRAQAVERTCILELARASALDIGRLADGFVCDSQRRNTWEVVLLPGFQPALVASQ